MNDHGNRHYRDARPIAIPGEESRLKVAILLFILGVIGVGVMLALIATNNL